MNKKWTQTDIVRAMKENMQFQMTHWAKHTPGLEVFSEKDVIIVISKVSDDTFNYVLGAKFSEKDAFRRTEDVIQLFKERKIPFSWWVGNYDTPSDLGSILVQQGLSFKEENIGMYAVLNEFSPGVPLKDLAFRRVLSYKQLQDFSEIIVKIGGSREAFEAIYRKIPQELYAAGNDFQLYVGYKNGIPVISGMLILKQGVAGIYYVATIPEERRQGFGTAMMEHLLLQAQRSGYEIATLQASSDGKSLYERLGFIACGCFKEYSMGSL